MFSITFEEIRICTGYRLNGEELRALPASTATTASIEPVYETLPGWMSDTTKIDRWEDLPANARAYAERLAEVVGSEVAMVGVGPDRAQSIMKPGSWLERQVGS